MHGMEQAWNVTAASRRTGRQAWASRRAKLIAFSSAVLALGGGLASAASYYVATNGSDSFPGTLAQPFATLEKARDTLRSSGPLTNGATVYVRGGTYFRTNTFALTSADSGPGTNLVVWMNYTNETPILIGGLPVVNFTTWQTNILLTDVSTQGFSGVHFRQLFFNGNRQILARYPNYSPSDPYGSGWAYVDGTPGDVYAECPTCSTTNFTYKVGDMPRTWENPTNAEVFVFPRFNFYNDIVPVCSINTNTRVITITRNPIDNSGEYEIRPGDRYYVQNVFEELDAPGEWYLDTTNKYLYFYAPSNITSATPIYAPVVTNIVTVASGASNITFQQFTLECCEGAAITLTNASNCLIAANTILNGGNYSQSGVIVSGGFTNGVVGNDISYVGRNGIELSGGTTATLTPCNNYADNNYIHHTGVFYKEGVGVNLYGVGNRASHNWIHDGPRFGILFYGQKNVVEYNHINDVMLETDDGGAIYSGQASWINGRGSVVRYNYCHDSTGYGQFSGVRGVATMCWGIYLDGFTSGVDVFGNIVTRIANAGIFINGGSYNYISNNIVSECLHSIAPPYGYSPQIYLVGYPTNTSTWTATLNDQYYSVHDQPAWSSMRGMDTAPTNYPYGPDGLTVCSNRIFCNIVSYTNNTPEAPLAYFLYHFGYDKNVFDYNLVYKDANGANLIYTNSYFVTWPQWQTMGEDVHSINGDPLFNSDYTLSSSSPALGLGFQQIPVSQIGPYASETRASWPIVKAPGKGFGTLPPPTKLRVMEVY